ncbi:MAG TPA: VOC family protein [Vicinamibacterales bacterium]|nr:VOC family protein [Vicinamibacterales bacterium]
MKFHALVVAAALLATSPFSTPAPLTAAVGGGAALHVTAVDTVGLTVSDMDRAVAFYTSVLTFEKVSDIEVAGRDYELMTGVFGARLRIVRLRLGDESIELTEYLTPKGRAMPADVRANDRLFQHVAIIVSDIDGAYERLRSRGVEHASTGPQRLPEWNPNAGGIGAFYFRDPDRHFLEILHFPAGKGLDKWHRSDRLFLGIDHTAIVVNDTDATLGLYRDALGMQVAGTSENYDTEQEHLNNVFGARLRITALRAGAGPGIELLEYLAPRDGRAAPIDLHANDIAHWQTTLLTDTPERAIDLGRRRAVSLVSPAVVEIPSGPLNIRRTLLVRDADGHALRLASR